MHAISDGVLGAARKINKYQIPRRPLGLITFRIMRTGCMEYEIWHMASFTQFFTLHTCTYFTSLWMELNN